MSMMYGKHRVVLSKNSRYNEDRDLWYHGRVSLCGSSSGTGGSYNPVGYWYKKNGLFYADLRSAYGSRDLVHDLGGLTSAQGLRKFIMSYAKERGL